MDAMVFAIVWLVLILGIAYSGNPGYGGNPTVGDYIMGFVVVTILISALIGMATVIHAAFAHVSIAFH